MAHSTLVGLDVAALEPAGQEAAAWGTGEDSDSGSDRVALESEGSDDPLEELPEGAPAGNTMHDDEDADLAFIDEPSDGGPDEHQDEDGEGSDPGNEDDGIPVRLPLRN